MKYWLTLLVLLSFSVAFAPRIPVDPEGGSSVGGNCDVVNRADKDPGIYFKCFPEYGQSSRGDYLGCNTYKECSCNSEHEETLCNAPSHGADPLGHCFITSTTSQGACPPNYDDGVYTTNSDGMCVLTVKEYLQYDDDGTRRLDSSRYRLFSQEFYKTDDAITSSGLEISCTDKGYWTDLRNVVGNSITDSIWCEPGPYYRGRKGEVSFCFNLNCADNSGWTFNSLDNSNCLCESATQCMTGGLCYGDNDHVCYEGYSRSSAGWQSTEDTLLMNGYKRVDVDDPNICWYYPNCDGSNNDDDFKLYKSGSFGWELQRQTNLPLFYDYETKLYTVIDCSSLSAVSDQLPDGSSFGEVCLPGGYYYNVVDQYCYYGLECVGCRDGFIGLADSSYCQLLGNYCKGNTGAINDACITDGDCDETNCDPDGGWIGYYTKCPKPGTVIGNKCYYADTDDVCTGSGCATRYDLMLGSFYRCDKREGAILKTVDVSPPTYELQSIPSFISFGFQDMAVYEGVSEELVPSCSCTGQDTMGRNPLCDPAGLNNVPYAVYGSATKGNYYSFQRSTPYASDDNGYNQQLAGDAANDDLIFTVDCGCMFPSKELINGYQWLGGGGIDETNPDDKTYVCDRLFGVDNCYWDFNEPLALESTTHGPVLNDYDIYCSGVTDGKPCDYYTNKIFNFLFDVNTLVDLKVNIFNENKTVPVYLSLFEKSFVKTSLDDEISINSLTYLEEDESISFSFELVSDFIDFNYLDASLSVFCNDQGGAGRLSVKVNEAHDVLELNCDGVGWSNGEFPRPIIDYLLPNDGSASAINVFTLKAVNGGVWVGLMDEYGGDSPLDTIYLADNFYETDNEIILFSGNQFSNFSGSLVEFNGPVLDVELYNDIFYVLTVADNGSPILVRVNYESWNTNDPYPVKLPFESFEGVVDKVTNAYGLLYYHDFITNGFNRLGAESYETSDALEGIQWLEGDIDSLFTGSDSGVYFIKTNDADATHLEALLLRDSLITSSRPFVIIDYDVDGLTDFVGVSACYHQDGGSILYSTELSDCVNPLAYEVSVWTHTSLGGFIRETIVDFVPVFTELVVGDFMMDEEFELLFKTPADSNLWVKGDFLPVPASSSSCSSFGKLWFTDYCEGATRLMDTTLLRPFSLEGDDWFSVNNVLYSLAGDGLHEYVGFNLNASPVDPAYRFLISEGRTNAAPLLLMPNFNVIESSVSINDFKLGETAGFNLLGKSLGSTMIGGADVTYFFNITQISTEFSSRYESFSFRLMVDSLPVNCQAPTNCAPAQCICKDTGKTCLCDTEGAYPCTGLIDLSTPEGVDNIATVVTCHLPEVSYGLPELKRFQVCVDAGEFEYENCFALDSFQPLASDPTGLIVDSVGVRKAGTTDAFVNELYLCSAGIDLQALIIDSNGYYDGFDAVTGVKVYAPGDSDPIITYPMAGSTGLSAGLIVAPEVIELPLSAPASGTSVTYTVMTYTGSYYDSPVGATFTLFGSVSCDGDPDRCDASFSSVESCHEEETGCFIWVNSMSCSGTASSCSVYDGCNAGECETKAADENDGCSVGDFNYCDGIGEGVTHCIYECVSGDLADDCTAAAISECSYYTGDCALDGMCAIAFDNVETPCIGGKCDGAGSCVECSVNTDCPNDGTQVSGQCLVYTGVCNADYTCGARVQTCPSYPDGNPCKVPSCSSGVCSFTIQGSCGPSGADYTCFDLNEQAVCKSPSTQAVCYPWMSGAWDTDDNVC